MYGNILKELNVNGETAKERIEALRHVPAQDLLAASLKSLQGEMWGISLEDGEGAIWKEPAIHLIAKGTGSCRSGKHRRRNCLLNMDANREMGSLDQ